MTRTDYLLLPIVLVLVVVTLLFTPLLWAYERMVRKQDRLEYLFREREGPPQ